MTSFRLASGGVDGTFHLSTEDFTSINSFYYLFFVQISFSLKIYLPFVQILLLTRFIISCSFTWMLRIYSCSWVAFLLC